ncbi:MAG: type II secretion system protein GspL, partial [Pseudoruegeria sp.]
MIPQTPKGKRRFYRFGQDTDVPTEPFVALVPGHAAPLVHLTLPDGIKGRARDRIARLQITDSLGQGEDRLVMRPFMPTGVKHNWQRLCLTDRGRLSDWRTTAEGWGDRCEALLPDYLSLPAAADVWSLSIDGAMLVARLGLQDGFSAETALAEQLLLRALATEPPKAIYADTPLPPDLLAETEIKNIPVLSDPAAFLPLGLGPLETLSQGELSLDLAKDPEDAEDQIRRQLIPWIAPVALLTLAALLWAVSTIIDVRRITEATAQLNATTRQEIRT